MGNERTRGEPLEQQIISILFNGGGGAGGGLVLPGNPGVTGWGRGFVGKDIAVMILGFAVLAVAVIATPWLQKRTQRSCVHHFGSVEQGMQLVHVFKVENHYESEIEVTRVSSSCGCTSTADLAGARLAPGGTVDVEVNLATGQSETRIAGTLVLWCRPLDNLGIERDIELAQLTLSADVCPDFLVRPVVANLGTISTSQSREFFFRPHRRKDAKVARIETFGPGISGRLASGADGQRVILAFSGSTLPRSTRIEGGAKLYTNSARVPTYFVHLEGYWEAPIEVVEDSVVVCNEASKKTVGLRGSKHFAIIQARLDMKDIGVAASVATDTSTVTIALQEKPVGKSR